MRKWFSSSIGRLRFTGILEGISLLMLIFITVPLKYLFDLPQGSAIIGPIHGFLFLLYIGLVLLVASEKGWKFGSVTWKLLLASFLPFGTFYVDKHILKPSHERELLETKD